jgi:PAS domain S-box-containing protein
MGLYAAIGAALALPCFWLVHALRHGALGPWGSLLILESVVAVSAAGIALAQTRSKRKLARKIYLRLVDELPIGVYEADAGGSGTIRAANATFAEMVDAENPETLVSRSILDLYDVPGDRRIFLDKLAETGSVHREQVAWRSLTGRKIWVSVTARLLRDKNGRAWMCVGTLEDITPRKEAENNMHHARHEVHEKSLALENRTRMLEQARLALLNIIKDLEGKQTQLVQAQQDLAGLNETLEAKVAQRTEEVYRLLSEKEAFIGQLGHDLKTPLTPLVGLLPEVREMVTDPEGRAMISMMVDNVSYMRNLVESTLQLARLGTHAAGQKREHVDLRRIVQAVLDAARTSLQTHEMHVQTDLPDPLIVRADPMALREVLHNLLENACKYTDGPGRIEITSRLHGGRVYLAVRDDGIGVGPEDLAHLFDEFYKVDPSRHDRSSTGLGLSICRRILQQHQGQILVESPGPGCGTTFTLVLACVRQDQPHTSPTSNEPGTEALESAT